MTTVKELPATASEPRASIALKLRDASVAIGLEPGSRWLLEPDCPIARCDIRKPGAAKPVWVWLVEDLATFVHGRRVMPGQPNPMDRY